MSGSSTDDNMDGFCEPRAPRSVLATAFNSNAGTNKLSLVLAENGSGVKASSELCASI
jgi:hypothetical protein